MRKFFLVAMAFGSLMFSAAQDYSGYDFMARYVKYNSGTYYPNPLTSAALISDFAGYWDNSFVIDLYLHSNLSSGFIDAIPSAIGEWNSISSYAKFTNAGTISSGFPNTINPPYNIIAEDESYFSGSDGRLGSFYPWIPLVSSCSEFSGGPILLGGVIRINPAYSYFFGVPLNNEYSGYTLLLHELGHMLGLGHVSYIKRTAVMHPSQQIGQLKLLTAADADFIGRLYGHDGLNVGTDPFYSSIPCDHFNPTERKDFTSENDGTFANGANSCFNCLYDENEYGVDCGGSCQSQCESICSGNTKTANYTSGDLIRNYTVVNNTITASGPSAHLIVAKGDYKYFQAGDYINFGPGFEIEADAYVDAVIDNCDCPPPCTPTMPNIFTPNCDGVNDFYWIRVNGWDSFVATIKNRWGTVVYANAGSISGYNKLAIWNGMTTSGHAVSDGNYSLDLSLSSSCSGKTYNKNGINIQVVEASTCMTSVGFNFNKSNWVEDDSFANDLNEVITISITDMHSAENLFNYLQSCTTLPHLSIYSTDGKLIYIGGLISNFVSKIHNLSSGIYFLRYRCGSLERVIQLVRTTK